MAFDLDKQVIQVMNIFSPIKARSIIICVIFSPWNALQIKAWDKTNLHHRSLATEHRTSTWQSTDPSPILTKRLWGRKDWTCTSAGRVEADGGAAGVEGEGSPETRWEPMPMNTEGKSSESSEGLRLKANAELGIGGDSQFQYQAHPNTRY